MSASASPRTRGLTALLVAMLLAAPACAPRARSDGPPPALWLYCDSQLAKEGDAARLAALWTRAARAGYTHVILVDPRFERLGSVDARYLADAARLKRVADSLGLEIVPGVFPIGRSSTLLASDPDLAEAVPVRGVTLEVRGGIARVVASPPVSLPARPGYMDSGVEFSEAVARVLPHGARTRFSFQVPVAPFRCYHVSVEVRTRDDDGAPMVGVRAGERELTYTRSLGLAPTQEWTRVDLVFPSLDHTGVTVWMGDWKPSHGTSEWRNWRIEEAGPVNLVRRDDTPFTIEGLAEGRDFGPVHDGLMGMDPWRGQYRTWHEPPAIRVARPEGTRLTASWWFVPVLYGKQVSICPSEPATLALLRDEATRVRALWGARSHMLLHDEIRLLGWDPACRARAATPGAVLAAHLRDCVRLLEGSRVYAWGDMVDPLQNAVRDYHLVAGDLAGSWEGLDSTVTIVNWNVEHAAESLRFFARRGHAQVIAGYYDGRPEEVRAWIAAARGVPRVEGIMYTTWKGDFDDLEAFAIEVRSAWGR
jgi:hypothetical protein